MFEFEEAGGLHDVFLSKNAVSNENFNFSEKWRETLIPGHFLLLLVRSHTHSNCRQCRAIEKQNFTGVQTSELIFLFYDFYIKRYFQFMNYFQIAKIKFYRILN